MRGMGWLREQGRKLVPFFGFEMVLGDTAIRRAGTGPKPAVLEDLDVLRCCIAYNQYGAYCVPESCAHRPAARLALRGGVHEPDTLQLMAQRCGEGDVVHAGTFFGDFLPALSRAVGSGALVWAFEPNSESFRCASITCALNGLENVRLRRSGLGAHADEGVLETADAQGRPLGGMSRFVRDNPGEGRVESVPLVAIDEVVPGDRHVSIIQLDVEGAERQALEGAMQTIRRCKPLLILESMKGNDLVRSEWFERSILALNYRESGRVHDNVVLEHAG